MNATMKNNTNDIDNMREIFEKIITTRRSVRGFTQQPIAEQTLNSIFELAQHTPSNCNTQPWYVHVVSGERCRLLKEKIYQAMSVGNMTFDFPYDGKYEGVYKERQYDAANTLYSAMGIQREDKVRRNEAFMRNFEAFGAPHIAFLFIPEEFGIRGAADIGMYAQSLMLSITAHGCASCPQTAMSFHADLIRAELGITTDKKLLFGISFGYEDLIVEANKARVGKAQINECVTFHK